MNDSGPEAGSRDKREVAPGLVMEREQAAEPDGRYVIYYKFERRPEGEMNEITVDVHDIECEACEGAIRKALDDAPGVEGVDVDIQKKQVHVRYDTSQTTVDGIRALIGQAGFDTT